ncbi:MAG: NAD(+) diphosphatase [Rhodospirillales bacterium]|nr:MAG: NAD(+) diphosphatase [Rhodospirillales bacterium]
MDKRGSPASFSLCYAGCSLDRSGRGADGPGWQAASRDHPNVAVVPVWRSSSFIVPGVPPVAAVFTGEAGRALLDAAAETAVLGLDEGGAPWLAADLSPLAEAQAAALMAPARAISLRRVATNLTGEEAARLAYARGLLHWHRHHRYCGACGAATESRDGGHRRVCSQPGCGAEHFPRTDPAVMILVTRAGSAAGRSDAACLLGRQPRWPPGFYSTLAGFVEPGESLEEAVIREVREEAGITVSRVRYRASQPWPFPASIMLGFRAEADQGVVIVPDPGELEDARWFTRGEIAAFHGLGLRLPTQESLARWLLDEWLAEGS